MSGLAENTLLILGIAAATIELMALFSAVHAIMHARTPQGAVAWAMGLIMLPFLSLPLYFIFGRNRFVGYVTARRQEDEKLSALAKRVQAYGLMFPGNFGERTPNIVAVEHLARMRFTGDNDARLLIDGEATFEAIFEAIESAKQYVLVQFFIVKEDELGRRFHAALCAKAQQGVPIYFLYDEIGSHQLSRGYVDTLRAAGVDAQAFHTTRGRRNRFQVNFRNHRKIVVVDGRTALLGGHNVGDEYVGKDSRFGHWRDTHVELRGPAVQGVQLSFVEDWYWKTQTLLELVWEPEAGNMSRNVLILPTGPADPLEACNLFFIHAINSAKERIWITSPYFVPGPEVMQALRLAALRGVQVRILLPERPDHLLVYLSAFSYLEEIQGLNIEIYRYQDGFMHQKVMLLDDAVGAVGTANFDNRSFRLNFEITAVVVDEEFNKALETMLCQDFDRSRRANLTDLTERPFFFQLAVKMARLMAPVQ